MATEALRNKAFQTVMRGFIETGRSPHYTELAASLGVSTDEACEAQHEAADHSLACWFAPETDNVSSWAPFSNIANQHRITIGGEQRWFGQCGAESLAISLLFPGQEVTIDSRCPSTAVPIKVRMKDGELLEATPPEAVVLVNQPFDTITTPFGKGQYSLAYS